MALNPYATFVTVSNAVPPGTAACDILKWDGSKYVPDDIIVVMNETGFLTTDEPVFSPLPSVGDSTIAGTHIEVGALIKVWINVPTTGPETFSTTVDGANNWSVTYTVMSGDVISVNADVAGKMPSTIVSHTPVTALLYWNMNEGSGATAADTGFPAGDNNGTIAGVDTIDYQWIAGKIGSNAIEFLTTTGNISGPDTGVPMGSNDRSVSIWFNVASFTPGFTLWFYGTVANNQACILAIPNATTLNFNFFFNDLVANVSPMSTGTWHNIVCTYDQGSNFGVIYLDGVLANSGTFAGGVSTVSTGTIKVSGRAGNEVIGQVDDFAVYDSVIDQSDVTYIWNGGVGNPALNLP